MTTLFALLKERKFVRLLLGLATVVPFEFLSLSGRHLPYQIEVAAFLLVALLFGRDIITKGIRSLFRLQFSNINLLMTIAIAGAFYLGVLEEAAIIIILFSLGEFLEDFGIEQSRSALESLVRSSPKTALLKDGNAVVPIEKVPVGAIIIIRNGDTIPFDGTIVSGSSLIDEAAITGEPLPRTKMQGDAVFAGSIAYQGYLEVRVDKPAKDSTLQKILDLTFAASGKKSKSQVFIQKFASVYTPLVIVVSIGTVVIPVLILGKPFDPWLTQALTLLIISCPCALVISTPVSVFSAVGNASKRGIVIKGGRFLEELGRVRAVAFDKTRTLTKGEPSITNVITYGGLSEETVLGHLGGLEEQSEHPISKAITEYARKKGFMLHEHKDFKATLGKGVEGVCLVCTDSHSCAGTLQYIQGEHGAIDPSIIAQAEKLEQEGKTVVFVSDGTKVEGIVALTDAIKAEAKDTIAMLKKLKVVPIMLTGDASAPAAYVAQELGISEVSAALLPQDKASKIEMLKKTYGAVAMTGDGVNDAPALALSSVGIAMGAVGSDVAIENADIAVMNDSIKAIPSLIVLGRKMNGIIRFNTGAAIVVKFVFLGLAMLGSSTLIGAIVADVGVSIFVIVNSLRLFESTPA